MGKLTFLFATHFKQNKQIKKQKKFNVSFPEQKENNSHHVTLTLIYDSILSVIPQTTAELTTTDERYENHLYAMVQWA